MAGRFRKIPNLFPKDKAGKNNIKVRVHHAKSHWCHKEILIKKRSDTSALVPDYNKCSPHQMPISESEVISSGLALECFFAMSDLAMSILGGRWYNNTSKALLIQVTLQTGDIIRSALPLWYSQSLK